MRIAAIVARTVRWPIAGTGAARGRSERAAVLVEVRTDRGAIGLGEAAPLPGMSRDTLDDAERAIAAFGRLTGTALADREAARLIVAATTAPPAARFALETAVFDALAREHGVSLAALLGAPGRPRVPLAAVVDDPETARAAFTAGIRCFKIKLGPDESLDRVRAIAAAAPGASLRIDANRSWPRAEVVDRLAALAALPIEYVEEPCRDAHELVQSGPLPCRLALDESLVELSPDELQPALDSGQLAALILKPALLGGLSACLELAALARAAGVAAVASHALDGPIGTAACAELALALAATAREPPGPPAGLAPHPALAGWRLPVAQLAADHVRPADAPGLGFVDLDLDLSRALRAVEPR
jgi:o-succinylbenzoate synthase